MLETKAVEYIPVAASDVPCRMRIKLGTRTFSLIFRYNDIEEVYTATLENTSGEILFTEWPIHYGTPMFDAIRTEDFPSPVILPYSFDDVQPEKITPENFGKEVKLYLFDRPDYIGENPSNAGYGY